MKYFRDLATDYLGPHTTRELVEVILYMTTAAAMVIFAIFSYFYVLHDLKTELRDMKTEFRELKTEIVSGLRGDTKMLKEMTRENKKIMDEISSELKEFTAEMKAINEEKSHEKQTNFQK